MNVFKRIGLAALVVIMAPVGLVIAVVLILGGWSQKDLNDYFGKMLKK